MVRSSGVTMRWASSTWSRSSAARASARRLIARAGGGAVCGEPLDRPVVHGAVGGDGDDRRGDIGIERPFPAPAGGACGAGRGVLRLLPEVVTLVDPHLECACLDALAFA